MTYPLQFYFDLADHVPLKLNLFARIHEMEVMAKQLNQLHSWQPQLKQSWLQENENTLKQVLDVFTQHVPQEIGDQNLDTETLHLLAEYTTRLQQLTQAIQNVT